MVLQKQNLKKKTLKKAKPYKAEDFQIVFK